MPRLEGKTAFVTGGGSGIGRAAAQIYAREGASVVVSDISDSGKDTVDMIHKNGGKAIFVSTDVTSPDSVNLAFDAARKAFGNVTILHNCAGGSSGKDGSVVDAPLEEFWRVIKLDLFGTILCCRAAIPGMKAAGGGSIVNMTSIVAVIAVDKIDFYTAAKGGIIALTRTLAFQHATDRIRVNALAPGVTMTERVVQLSGGDVSRYALSHKQIGGPSRPEDIANAALFLASDESVKITGQVLPVDGGASIW